MTEIEFRLLGAMQLRVDDEPAKLPGAAERGLLALLLLSPGRTVAASSLIDRLWSESALPADPLNALQLRVSKLRRALAAHGVDVIVREASGYRADVDRDRVDLHRFVSLVQAARTAARRTAAGDALALYDEALALWRDDPLADFAGEGWATVEAARLDQLHRAALTERAEAALVAGRHVEVAADLEPTVARDPGQEAIAGLLMTALYRAGRQADALDVFARTRRHLDDELGLQPSAALRTLHQRILEQDDALAAVPAQPGTAGSAGAEAGPAASAAQTPAVGQEADTGPKRTLPIPALRMIGRDDELAQLSDALTRQRLVTLVGPGGAGKTSLAMASAHQLADHFEQHVHLARLAAVSNPADVPLAVADALGVPLDGADPNAAVRARLLAYLANRRLMLVLDNCEHVIDAVATLVDSILGAAAHVTVLATSREALAVPGEVQLSVAPLAVPPEGTPAGQVLQFPAAVLFVERASAVRASLPLSEPDLLALAQVCRQLDGLPLALELAAARMSSLSLPDLAGRLGDRFGLLTSGRRTAEARQRTLRATVEWSHALLSQPEQQAFRRLAVFHGGWTLEAAETVVAGEDIPAGEVFDVLDHLVNRSMVVLEPGSPSRYRMLETLRQYAVEELDASGERDDTAALHATFFRHVAEQAEQSLRGHGQRAALQRLRNEHPNLRAALARLSADPSRVEDGLRLAGSLALFWHLGRHVEGREVLSKLIATPGGSQQARARALQAVSIVERPRACLVHPSPRCAETALESLQLFEAEGDAHRAALSKVLLAVELLNGSDPGRFVQLLAEAEEQFSAQADHWGHAVVAFVRLQNFMRRGDEPRSRAMGRTASEAFRRLDDAWGLSAVLYHLGWGLKEFGRYAEAIPVLEQAIEVSSSAGVFNTAQWALSDLGVALLGLGEREAASAAFDRAASASEEVGDAAGVVLAGLGRAQIAQIDGNVATARPLFEEAVRGLTQLGTPLWGGHALAGVAWCDWRDGLLDDAAERYTQVHTAGQQYSEPTLLATGLEGLARVAASMGQRDEAQVRLNEAVEVRQASARPAPPQEQAELDDLWGQVDEVAGAAVRLGAPRASMDVARSGQFTSR
ncbi:MULTISPECIES: AfsR/SARP family transcriptional regulator [unclassified Modestobacter]|uniref:AfsR/SARP family transcriptional regulator n=1 Tax=unclassified Modestobacter TaxID=2643866 RepID=UPI0022AA0357|nr:MULTISPECIES: BTAD domain-containing putative transcriptional regulator [unclassified Modestobacter]MCZ2825859.1 BTAD domain-containing putative transcriptional regulator [Modestobacter sp. VKM Ac-2981]MCZ2853076.1 BTAD domain-containing putative transcriptional regulator [Modestobacter sp. VKM Ac-2982]